VKKFSSFIVEARTTKASQEARRLGLVGDGHGDWYDRTGVLKAKTVRGELEMFSNRAGKEDELGTPGSSAAAVVARKGSSRDDAPNKTGSATGSSAADSNPNSTNGQAKAALQQVSRDQPLTIAFDKFDNDETTLNILQAVEEVSGGDYYYIFPSRDTNIQELKDAYPEIGDAFVDDTNAETIYDVLSSLYENGFDAVSIVVRQSRAKEISELALKANGQLYNFVMLNVIPVDERSIREQYIAGDIFQNGSMIESNGKTGQVFRRGANHLICMTEDKQVFRAWISEAKEVDKFFLAMDF
jgi:hypothetical protein